MTTETLCDTVRTTDAVRTQRKKANDQSGRKRLARGSWPDLDMEGSLGLDMVG